MGHSHTDSEFLSSQLILYQDQVGGFQLMKEYSKWVALNQIFGKAIKNNNTRSSY
jgi:isopenicillin N synthase-like dioxygenase